MTAGRVELSLERRTGFRLNAVFDIPEKGITVLYGPSGCGKTTVLRCTAGLERASGAVTVGGHVWQDDAEGIFIPTWKRRLGYVFQEASLFTHLNVEENLTFGLRRTADAAAGRERLETAVGLLGIGDLRARRVQELSGGERQRVAIARALAMTPDIILMDEPLAALDWERKQEILPWLEKLRDELSVPMLYVTHSADEMARLADRLVCFEKGSIVAEGPLEEVLLRMWPGASSDGASAVISGTVSGTDPNWKTSFVTSGGLTVEVSDTLRSIGEQVRLRVMARDVSLTLVRPEKTSIRNIFPARIEAIDQISGNANLMVRLNADGVRLLARITAHSAAELSLAPGSEVYAQVKAVALII